MTVYFESKVSNSDDFFQENRSSLIERLNELKEVSEETGIPIDSVINYVGYNIIANYLENDVSCSIAKINNSLDYITEAITKISKNFEERK